jgi:integrase
VQKAVKEAAQEARIHKPVSVHTLRHYAGSRTMPSDGRSEFGVGPKLHLETGTATRDRSA